MIHPSKSLEELITGIEAIHAPDIAGFDEAACIECATAWPCDTATFLAEWKELAQ